MELLYVTIIALGAFLALWHQNARMARLCREILASDRKLPPGVRVDPIPESQKPKPRPTEEQILKSRIQLMKDADRRTMNG